MAKNLQTGQELQKTYKYKQLYSYYKNSREFEEIDCIDIGKKTKLFSI
jgi:hypothetical protein